MEEFDLAADRVGFIGSQVLPTIEATQSAGTFGRIPLEALLQNPDVTRTSRSGYPRGDWNFTEDSYATQERGFEVPVDARDARFYANYFDAEMSAANLARDTVLRAREKRIADLVFNATTWNGASLTTGITNEWDSNHKNNAVPIDDVENAVRKVYEGTGLWPNALIINRIVFRNLRNLDQIVDRITASGAGSPAKPSDITAEMLAAVFDLDFVIVAGASKNTANKGQTATPGQIWSSEYAMVCRIATTNDIKEPCLGRTIHWAEDGSEIGAAMETYRDEGIRGDVARARHDVQEKIFYKELGHLLSNVTTL